MSDLKSTPSASFNSKRIFDVQFAEKYGLQESIFIQHLSYWIDQNEHLSECRFDGTIWMYHTYANLAKKAFPFWTRNQVLRLVQKMVKSNILQVKLHDDNKKGLWFSFHPDFELYVATTPTKIVDNIEDNFDEPMQNCTGTHAELHRSGGDTNILNNNNNKHMVTKVTDSDQDLDNRFEEFWEHVPPGRKIKKKECRRIFKNIVKKRKVDPALIINGMMLFSQFMEFKYKIQGKTLQIEFFPHPTTWLRGERWSETDEWEKQAANLRTEMKSQNSLGYQRCVAYQCAEMATHNITYREEYKTKRLVVCNRHCEKFKHNEQFTSGKIQ